MILERATVDDAKEIRDLQKLSYRNEAEIYNDCAIPPLTQTLEEMKFDFINQLFIKACVDVNIVGSVRAYMKQDTCLIGRLMVHPDLQNQGIGTQLMKKIEKCFNQVRRYELFTGYRSEGNLYLYQKLGYSIFKTEKISEHVSILYLEKLNQTS